MRGLSAIICAAALIASGAAYAEDDAALVTGRSVAVSGTCDRVTPVCASMGGNRLVPYDNECHARADGAESVSFSGCFDEN